MPVYLKMQGINGSATDANHKDWVQADFMAWGASRNIKFKTGSMANREGGALAFQEIEIRKKIDAGTFQIGKAFWNKKAMDEVEVDICRQGDGGGDVSLLKLTLSDVLLSVYDIWAEGDVPMERFNLNYSKFEEKNVTAPKDNKTGDPAVTGYNLSDNTIV